MKSQSITKGIAVAAAVMFGACQTGSVTAQDYDCCNEKEMTYQNGGVPLAGVLLYPKEDGVYPGIVVLQGAGTSGRSNKWSRLVAETLVKDGYAVLLTDKRGSGKSGGDWRTADFDDLADDALAGVAAIRPLAFVDDDEIGLIGLSQGGHVAPVAAAKGNVQFVIDFVGSALPMKDTLIHELEQTYRQAGADDATVEFLQTMTYASFRYIETGEGWDDYLAIRKTIEENVGEPAVESWPTTKDDWYWDFWRPLSSFDPIPYWKTVVEKKGLPVFVAYGELDEFDNVPVKDSVARFAKEIPDGNLTVNVYAGTGHSLMNEEKRKNGELVLVQPLIDDLKAWLEENVKHGGD